MNAYKRQIVKEQRGFLIRKAEKLKHILQEEKDLGLELTVPEEEIAECLRKAEEIQAKLDSEEYNEEDEYLIYNNEEETKKHEHSYFQPVESR